MSKKMNRLSCGMSWEKITSRRWHRKGLPLLVSPKLLRARGCGQVDVAVIDRGTIYVVECKSGGEVARVQYQRLKRSAHFLSTVLRRPSQIRIESR